MSLQVYCVKHKLKFDKNPIYDFFLDVKEFEKRIKFLENLETAESLHFYEGELVMFQKDDKNTKLTQKDGDTCLLKLKVRK